MHIKIDAHFVRQHYLFQTAKLPHVSLHEQLAYITKAYSTHSLSLGRANTTCLFRREFKGGGWMLTCTCVLCVSRRVERV